MSTHDYTIKKGFTRPPLRSRLVYENLDAVVLTGIGTTVRFVMTAKATGVVKIDALATIENATTAAVKYDFIAGDTDTVGEYNGKFVVVYGDGSTEPVPNNEQVPFITIAVTPAA